MSKQVDYGNGSLVSYEESDYYPDGGPGNNSHGWLGEVTNKYWVNNGGGQWSSTLLSQNVYGYDTAGNRLTNAVTLNGTTRTEVYGYDELNRLTSVDYGDGGTQAYSFDAMGNRLEKNDSVSGDEDYTYNAANMLLTRGTSSYTNDLDGNTLTGGGRTNTWDSQNRLVGCSYNSNNSSYVYGADGFRHRSVVNGTTTDFALDGQFFVRELQGGATYATYLTGPTGPLYRRDATGETLRWYIYDGLGSVLGEVDASGNLDATRTYDVYGLARSTTGTPTSKHGWVGQLGHTSEDETGLVYMRARYMDPVVGRFLSEDPARNGSNWFVYADSNPASVNDLSGEDGNLAEVSMVMGLLGAFFGFLTGFFGSIIDQSMSSDGPIDYAKATADGGVGALLGGLACGISGYVAGVYAAAGAAAPTGLAAVVADIEGEQAFIAFEISDEDQAAFWAG